MHFIRNVVFNNAIGVTCIIGNGLKKHMEKNLKKQKKPGDCIVIAADHGGYELKEIVKDELHALGYDILDLGVDDGSVRVDYPDYAHALARCISDDQAAFGVLTCGSGLGMSMVANRYAEIRAALCYDSLTARLARQHNDANVLVMGGRLIGPETARDCLRSFMSARFEGGRHVRRIAQFNLDPE